MKHSITLGKIKSDSGIDLILKMENKLIQKGLPYNDERYSTETLFYLFDGENKFTLRTEEVFILLGINFPMKKTSDDNWPNIID